MTAYYNENDPKAAAWLRELIFDGQIAWGDVDERSIEDVLPEGRRTIPRCQRRNDIGYIQPTRRLAGWPDDRAVWTGSCPCQPFSLAGKGGGFADERHLWPAFHWLVQQRHPSTIFGEQVASPAGLNWFDLVSTDLEAANHAVGAVDICAASVGAAHIRQRLYWVAEQQHRRGNTRTRGRVELAECGSLGELGNSRSGRSRGHTGEVSRAEGSIERGLRSQPDEFEPSGAISGVAHSSSTGLEVWGEQQAWGQREAVERSGTPWDRCEWIQCRDGKSRPIEPGTFPLAHGIPGRVGLLRGYGNAIVPQVAAAFIGAYLDV